MSKHIFDYELPDYPEWVVTAQHVHVDRSHRLVANIALRNGIVRHTGRVRLSEADTWGDWLDKAVQPGGPTVDRLREALYNVYADAESLEREGEDVEPVPGGQADRIVSLVDVDQLFHDGDRAYAIVDIHGHDEVLAVNEYRFKRWLSAKVRREEGWTPSKEILSTASLALEGMAFDDGPERTVHIRVAEHGGVVYLDLADDERRIVRIGPDGWTVVTSAPVLFRRPNGTAPLPVPRPGGTLQELRRFVNVDSDGDKTLALIVAFVLSCFRGGPYPVLVIHGEHGSAKTTAAELVRSLVDPNVAPTRTMPRKEEDMIIAAAHAHVQVYDNVSGISAALSDAMCRLSTGSGFSKRKLFSDDDEVILHGKAPIILTGIAQVADRADLLDRCVLVQLPSIPEDKRRPEATLRAEFETVRPLLLGALLDAVAIGLQRLPTMTLPTLPRMADFALWAEATEAGLPWKPGTFRAAYYANRGEANALALDASSIVAPLQMIMEQRPEWRGTPTELLAALALKADEVTRNNPAWPKDPSKLSQHLKRIAPNLRGVGFDAQQGPRTGRSRQWIIRHTVQSAVTGVTGVTSTPGLGLDTSSDSGRSDGSDGSDGTLQGVDPAACARCPWCSEPVTLDPDGAPLCDNCEWWGSTP